MGGLTRIMHLDSRRTPLFYSYTLLHMTSSTLPPLLACVLSRCLKLHRKATTYRSRQPIVEQVLRNAGAA